MFVIAIISDLFETNSDIHASGFLCPVSYDQNTDLQVQ